MTNVHLIDHPLVQHKLTLMRRKDASTNSFRRLLNELAMLMAYEVTRDVGMQEIDIETPLESMKAKVIDGKKLVFVSILRAGTGILEGMLSVVPGARVGHIGLYRDPATLNCVEYYFKAPADVAQRTVVVIDPMLATGNTAIAAVDRLKETGVTQIRMACLLCSPEGLSKFQGHHPGIPVWTAASPVGFWMLSDPSDLIGGIGGNRYGWFAYNQFSTLAFDNAELRTKDAAVPEPGTWVLVFTAMLSLFGFGMMRRRSDA